MRFLKFLLLLTVFLFCLPLSALFNYYEVYPPTIQTFYGTNIYRGDRHEDFSGDYVAILSDGSAWKIHPKSNKEYTTWNPNDYIRVGVRTDFYWFKREHKFMLHNESNGSKVKAMLVQLPTYPVEIIATEMYYKGTSPEYTHVTRWVWKNGEYTEETDSVFIGYKPSDPRKILKLSDGSVWVIKDHFDDFKLGTKIYIGAQGIPKKFYDFIMITGDQREAIWTWGRPQKIGS